MHGTYAANMAVAESDLLVAVGVRFDDRVTGKLATFAPHARVIHVEIDPANIGKNRAADISLTADARQALQALRAEVSSRGPEAIDESIAGRARWWEQLRAWQQEQPLRFAASSRDEIKPQHVIRELHRLTRGEALVVSDVGQHQMWEAQYYRHERPRTLITSGGLGTMGFALPAAIGAKIARPDAEVWAVVGDGGFQMTMCELATVVQENLDVKIAIVNNGYLGMVRQWQEFFYEKRYAATPLVNPNFTKLAEAFGIRSMAVSARSDVIPAVAEARRHAGPVLIDFQVEQEDSVYPMVPAGADLHAMIRRPSPIVETAAD